MTPLGSARRTWLVGAVALVVLAGALWMLHHHSREQECQHGGDRVSVSALVIATGPSGLPYRLAQMGAPAVYADDRAAQVYIVDVAWDGTAGPDGFYELILLDDRLAPPKPIRAYSSWSEDGTRTNLGWGSYDALSQHYPWLARTADRQTPAGWTNDTLAAGVPAAQTGEVTLTYTLGRNDLPTANPARDLILAMAYVGSDGEICWAKQVPLRSAGQEESRRPL